MTRASIQRVHLLATVGRMTPEPAPVPVRDERGPFVGELGELALLDRILNRLPTAPSLPLGPGDDAAVLAAPDGRVVVTTDTMIEGPDFRRSWSSPEQLGRKAVTSNLADVAAMGAAPTGITVALAVPSQLPAEWAERFADGIRDELQASAPGCGVIGGDLATSERIVIAITAFGDLENRAPVRRTGAHVGDVLALAGEAGTSAAGLRILFSHVDDEASSHGMGELGHHLGTRDEHTAALLRAHLEPRAPIAAGRAAALAGATGMLDVSDGLLLDATRLANASGVTLDLRAEAFTPWTRPLDDHLAVALPLARSRERAPSALELVLGGGENHALLATFPPDATLPHPFRPIGEVRDRAASAAPVTLDGVAQDALGWDPYAR